MKVWPKGQGEFLTGDEKAKFDAGTAAFRKCLLTDTPRSRMGRAMLGVQLAMLDAAGVDVPPDSSGSDVFYGLWALEAEHPERRSLTNKLRDHFLRGAGVVIGDAFVNPEPPSYVDAFRTIVASARVMHPEWFARDFKPRRKLQVVYNDDSTVDVDFVPYAN